MEYKSWVSGRNYLDGILVSLDCLILGGGSIVSGILIVWGVRWILGVGF